MSVLIEDMQIPECRSKSYGVPDLYHIVGDIICYPNGEVKLRGFLGKEEVEYPLISIPLHGKIIEAEPIMKYITDGLNSGEFGYDQIKVLAEIQYAPSIILEEKKKRRIQNGN